MTKNKAESVHRMEAERSTGACTKFRSNNIGEHVRPLRTQLKEPEYGKLYEAYSSKGKKSAASGGRTSAFAMTSQTLSLRAR